MNWNSVLIQSEINDDDKVFPLSKCPEGFVIEALIKDKLWVCHNFKFSGGFMDFAFFDYSYLCDDSNETYTTLMMHGSGPSNNLRECRHTFWGEDGYIFYPQKSHIIAALDWLEKYYDL
jgi:hypothetical protein